jgi:hypothetical protein
MLTLQEPHIERCEHQNDADIYYQPQPELVSEGKDVHADHEGYHREHIKYDADLSSHRLFLLCATQWGKSGDHRNLARSGHCDHHRELPT